MEPPIVGRPADGRIGAFAEFMAIKQDDVAIRPKAPAWKQQFSSTWSA